MDYEDTQDRMMKVFKTWSDVNQVEHIVKLLGEVKYHQHTQIEAALQPLLQRDFITIFPQRGLTHISEKILSYLDSRSLFNASCVCREWRRIIGDGLLWKKLIEKKVRSDKLWAGIVKRRQYDKDLFKPTIDNCDPTKHQKLYLNIMADAIDVEERWRSCEHTKRQIVCNSANSKGVYCIQSDDDKIVSGLRDNTIKIWDKHTLQCTRTFHGHNGSVLCLQFDGSLIVSGSSDATVRFWDMKDSENSQPISTISKHSEAVLHLKFNKKMMVTCSKDKTIIVWNLVSPKDVRVKNILYGHRAAVNVVDFDDKYIVSASGDRSIKVWDSNTFEFVKTLNGHRRGIACLQYKDKLIVSGSSDNSIRIWDIESGTCLKTLEGHEDLVRCIRFDSKRIVSGAYDGRIKIWDLEAALAEESQTSDIQPCIGTLHSHTGRVFRIQFDELQIVSSSHDDTIIIWDILNPQPVTPFPISSSTLALTDITDSVKSIKSESPTI